MNVLESPIERLRPLLGMKCWDYCVIWKLGGDRRCIEWMGCCCGGADGEPKREEQLFPVSPIIPCRDVMFQHPRTSTCDALAELPSSMPLDSGYHTQALISNQPRWLNPSNISESSISKEIIGTRVVIPVSGGLVELFVAKHVPEDQQMIEFVMAQFNPTWEQETMINEQSVDRSSLNEGFGREHPIDQSAKSFLPNTYTPKNANNFQPWIPPLTDNLNLPWDLSADQIRMCGSPMNFFGGQQFAPSDSRPKSDIFFEGLTDAGLSDNLPLFNPAIDNRYPDSAALPPSLRNSCSSVHQSLMEAAVTKEPGFDKDPVKQENGRGDSVSDCSDQVEEDDDQKIVGRSGRRHQSKNLLAERKRRKKLNDRLYALRALVPKITKMDRAAILGDAIEFVKELEKQVKDLQDELEESPEEGAKENGTTTNNSTQLEIPNENAVSHGDEGSPDGTADHGTRCSSNTGTRDVMKQNQESRSTDDRTQQMEPQVEVSQVDGNEFCLKMLCEHKPGGFVRLMEALNSLGLEVTNANVTTFRALVMNVFRVKKMDDEVVQAEQVRDSLLELTRNPNPGWSENGRATENGGTDYYQHHQNHLNSQHLHPHLHHLHHQA